MAQRNPPADPLAQWLSLVWDRPERSYNPDLKDFFASLLGYPRDKVVTEDNAAGGYPDLKLLTPDATAWAVGEMKKDDAFLVDPNRRGALWLEKRRYVDGLTRYVAFITAHFLWVVLADGSPIAGWEDPLDLRTLSLGELRDRLAFLSYAQAGHERQWLDFCEGTFPYSYLKLSEPNTLRRLRGDLQSSFTELTSASTKALEFFEERNKDYLRRKADIERNVFKQDDKRRALARLELEFDFVRRLFESLSQFEAQYGREVDKESDATKRIREAFLADSVASLIARVLFLRLVEDLGLTRKRRLSNGGPKNWSRFVEKLTGDARALVRLASDDVARIYQEPFAPTVFDWIQYANGELDKSLQRTILRLNAYDFAGLSEEILGDIYQQFLPKQKRKRLGEYYTPPSIVDWIMDRTVGEHGDASLLDPSCGSGSFLVRYAHRRLEDARSRGLDIALVGAQVQEEVWGFDLNPFASFVSLFQITWALLRFGGALVDRPRVHVYNLNSLLSDADFAPYIGEEHLAPGSKARDERKWKYVLGNPPYIRAERVKYGAEMRDQWSQVWGQNSDTGLVFLYRALTEWLEPGGYLGMVISGGYANSEAAARVWRLLQPGEGGRAAIRKIAWLEFVEEGGKPKPVWEVARVPLIVIIERTPAREDDTIELHVPNAWPEDRPVAVRYGDFFDHRVNPRVTNQVSSWGEYLLPLLRSEDVPILQKLYPDGKRLVQLSEIVDWTYGIQRGGVEVTAEPEGKKPIEVVGGRSLAVAWHGESAGWVDLDAVANRPYGKLSLWRDPKSRSKPMIFAPNISSAPFASIGNDIAALDTIIVGEVDKPETAMAVAAYVNSELARFYWGLRLRSGVIQGYYAHIYPRTLDALPWPTAITSEQEQTLAAHYRHLAQIAGRAKDNPREWLLTEAEGRIALKSLRITDLRLGLRIEDPSMDAKADELLLDGARIKAGLFPWLEFADADIAEYVFLLLTLNLEEETSVRVQEIQTLLIPDDYTSLMNEYRRKEVVSGSVEQDFQTVLAGMDAAVYDVFALANEERAYVQARLATFPLDRMQPRYPWQTVRPRKIKAYMADRFT